MTEREPRHTGRSPVERGFAMKVHAVAKVRLDADGRVTGVEWGPVNTETNEWHTEPQVADVCLD